MATEPYRPVKVAVIGSGLAGLTTALALTKGKVTSQKSRDPVKFDVHLFEKSKTIGMDAASISIGEGKDTFRIDVPMRAIMSGYYARLMKLYRYLSIPIKPAKFNFGWYRITSGSPQMVSPDKVASYTNNQSYMLYSDPCLIGKIVRPPFGKRGVCTVVTGWWEAMIVMISYVWIVALALWMKHRGHLRNQHHPMANLSLHQWFRRYHFHPYFISHIFVPLFAAVCTCSWDSVLEYPAVVILEYLAMGFYNTSFVVDDGVQRVVTSMTYPLEQIHLDTTITAIRPRLNHQRGHILIDSNGDEYEVDHVIFATPANHAATLLDSYRQYLEAMPSQHMDRFKGDIRILRTQAWALRQFPYDKSLVVNHTDVRLLPRDPKSWRVLNLATVDPSVDVGKSHYTIPFPHHTTMTTHILKCPTQRQAMPKNFCCRQPIPVFLQKRVRCSQRHGLNAQR